MTRGQIRLFFLLLFLLLAALPLPATFLPERPARAAEHRQTAEKTQAFRQWLQGRLLPAAVAEGLPEAFVRKTLNGLRPALDLPDLRRKGRLPRRQRQAEFGPPAPYFAERRLRPLIREGRRLLQRHDRLLSRIRKTYGVPAPVIVAIWGKESHYGRARIPYDALRVLATQAWAGRRKEMFLAETLAALRILHEGHIPRRLLKGSWAGALGQPQMLPRRYLAHAVDMDGDGRRDIWKSVPDVLGSIAAFLAHAGWRPDRPWGWEVRLTPGVSCTLEGPDQGHPLRWWLRAGISRADGRPFPRRLLSVQTYLVLPAGRYGPAFLVTDNFYALKAYNMSDLYALFIGHLADRMTGRTKGPFRGRWGNVGHLLRADVARIQQHLVALGHDVGGIDGLAGFRTRRAIGRWQRKHALAPDCFPTGALLRRMGIRAPGSPRP
jgi:lytic murein transglycosylase